MDSPYHFMFIMGLFALTFILLYEIITVLIFGIDRNFNGVFFQFRENIKKYNYWYILLFIADILSAFIWGPSIQLTVYFFTPCHIIISESLSQIVSTIINGMIIDFPVGIRAIIYIFFVIIIFATLLYNEVIVINICNLNKDTKIMILFRQNSETEDLMTMRTMDSIPEIENYKISGDDRLSGLKNEFEEELQL